MSTLMQAKTSHNPPPDQSFHKQIYSDVRSRTTNQITGDYGEQYVALLLKRAGYDVEICSHLRFSGDLSLLDKLTGEFLRIEVKTAFESKRGTYQFCLFKPSFTDCSYSDYVALLCIDKHKKHYLYIINAALFQRSKCVTLTSHPTRYKGKWSPFLIRNDIDFESIRETERLWVGL